MTGNKSSPRTARAKRDGFIIRDFTTGEEVRFIACRKNGNMREVAHEGLLRNMNLDRFGVVDTREEKE